MSWFRRTPIGEVRWLSIDCETSGLDARRDRLLAFGAVPITAGRIELARALGAVLRQAEPSGDANIAIHGIGGEAQRAGRPAAESLRELSALAAGRVPIAFHAPFDTEVLRRECASAGVPPLPKKWLDLARFAPALLPGQAAQRRSLEEWLGAFGIAPEARHEALADALGAAQLALALLAEAERQGVRTLEDALGLAASARWVTGK